MQLPVSTLVQKLENPIASFGLLGIPEISTLIVSQRSTGGWNAPTENRNIIERFQNMYSRFAGKLFSKLFAICQ